MLQSGEFAVQLASRDAESEADLQVLASYRSDYEVSLVTRMSCAVISTFAPKPDPIVNCALKLIELKTNPEG